MKKTLISVLLIIVFVLSASVPVLAEGVDKSNVPVQSQRIPNVVAVLFNDTGNGYFTIHVSNVGIDKVDRVSFYLEVWSVYGKAHFSHQVHVDIYPFISQMNSFYVANWTTRPRKKPPI